MKYHDGAPLRRLGDVPAMGAERYGEKLAVEYRGDEQSYADLEARSNRVANALVDAGIDPGDRVALYLENSLQFPESLFGVVKAGAVAVPLNHRMDRGRLEYVLEDSGAEALVTSPVLPSVGTDLADHVPLSFIPGGAEGMEDYDEHVGAASPEFDRAERTFEDVAVQPYTSGTTGDPKGVLTTHENLLSTAQSYASRGGADPETDVALCFLPLFHMYGLSVVLLNGLYNGASVVLRTIPVPADLLATITEFGVTQFAAVPAVYIEMLEELETNPDAYDVSSIRTLGSGAAPLADDTRRRIEDAFDTPLTEGWGMTETSPAGTTESTYGVRKGAGCIGQPLPDIEMKLVDPDTRETKVPAAALDPTAATTLESHGIDPDDEDQVTGESPSAARRCSPATTRCLRRTTRSSRTGRRTAPPGGRAGSETTRETGAGSTRRTSPASTGTGSSGWSTGPTTCSSSAARTSTPPRSRTRCSITRTSRPPPSSPPTTRRRGRRRSPTSSPNRGSRSRRASANSGGSLSSGRRPTRTRGGSSSSTNSRGAVPERSSGTSSRPTPRTGSTDRWSRVRNSTTAARNQPPPTSLTVTGSLVEGGFDVGLAVSCRRGGRSLLTRVERPSGSASPPFSGRATAACDTGDVCDGIAGCRYDGPWKKCIG